MSWWMQLLEEHWNNVRNKIQDTAKKYGTLPTIILLIYFIGMILLLGWMRFYFHTIAMHG